MAGSGGSAAYAGYLSGMAIAVTKNRVSAAEFNLFNHIGEIVTSALIGT